MASNNNDNNNKKKTNGDIQVENELGEEQKENECENCIENIC